MWCTVQWSPSDFVLFALITPKGTSRRLCWLTEQNPQQRTFPTLSLFVLQSPFKFWIWMMFCRYWWWHSSYVTDIYEFLFWYLAPVLMTGNRETGPGWRWVVILQTWMEVRWDLGGAEMQVFAPGMRWGGTCMKVRPTSRALDRCGMGPARSWDAIVGTWMSVRSNFHGGETWILGPRCGWNRTWMKVRHTS